MMDNEWPSLPPDPRLLNLDERLFEIIADHFKPNVDLVAIHLRDARNMLAGVSDGSGFDRAFTKAVIILSAAALESNLAYLSDLTLMIARHRPHLYLRPQLDYLRGTEQYVNDKGDLKTRRVKQRLEEKLKVVPSLLARSMGRKYRLSPRSAAFQLLRRPIELRDVIVHPRWNRYASHVGWYDAAQSIDAVELYLQSIRSQLHPYLSFIDLFLYTIPAGGHKDDTAIAHRTTDQKRRKRRFVPMHKAGVPEIINREWLEAQFLTEFALQSQTEGDSPGSMLTRSALVLLYAMLDAQLALMAEAHLHTKKFSFEPSEALFLSEAAAGVDSDGAISVIESHTHFKQRIVGIPRILARRVEPATS